MPKQERQKKSTATNRAKTFSDARVVAVSPISLSKVEDEIFQSIVISRERDTWSPNDLRQAAKMAKLEALAETEWDELLTEGTIIINERGTQIENPRNRVYNTLLNSINQVSSKLGLTASQRGVAGNKQAARNDQQTAAKKAMDKDDDLIPKANTH